ncbi:hypothetical protein GCM10007301_24960 [Azorhizobium oxalatiphilum]|uniref:Uncharacterized protein n=1 Tax=Azorhizobium oxalatiphilum TaxID=980631 RepID=A0A917BYW7_9HYPH|nr:hypothetical protein [Azorhizobium oxalatiphilum]GGF64130.1 hypothetical protein GCM10007301_24960 [Azorhizobium oxalatiphilum]
MRRLSVILIATLLPVMVALTLFGALHAWASSFDGLPAPFEPPVPAWDLGLIRHR